MATDAPDHTLIIEIGITLGGNSVPPSATTEKAIASFGTYSGAATTYQTVASWTVAASKAGVLASVELETDNYAKTLWQLTVAGEVKFTGAAPQGPLDLTFPNVNLAPGDVVLLEAKSSDGTAIVADGVITGKEVG